MMGVGKSTIGKIISKKLSFDFVDIDKLIEEKEGCSINIIFKNEGESYFRKVEKEITFNELMKKNTVISLGGGTFLNKSIRRTIKINCISFWVDVSTEILVKRLKKTKKRPLLFKKNLTETINKIYLNRKKIYNEANFRVKCNFLQPENIANKILKLYENSNNKI